MSLHRQADGERTECGRLFGHGSHRFDRFLRFDRLLRFHRFDKFHRFDRFGTRRT